MVGYGESKKITVVIKYIILIVVGFVMIYPLLWMFAATFKSNTEIFTSMGLWTSHPTLEGYRSAFTVNYGGSITLLKSMLNTYSYVIPKVIFTVISSTITAYGFSRFNFPGKKILFSILMATLFLPQVVLNVPQFVLFSNWGWVGSKLYLPIIVPTMFALETYFVYLLIQFMRSIPRDMDEAAEIDGANSIQRLWYVIIPMLRPAIVSVALFQFMWSCNDFMGPLLYVNTPSKYPAAIFAKLSMDTDAAFDWNRILAISLITIIPQIIVFFMAQDQFIDGIQAGALKG